MAAPAHRLDPQGQGTAATTAAGPPLLQPYRDLWRLVGKEVVLADNASWLFRAAPYLVFAFTWVAASLVPTFATGLLFCLDRRSDRHHRAAGQRRFFLALAGMDVGTGFGGIGASREMMIASLAEPAMMMIVFTLALIGGSTQLRPSSVHAVGRRRAARASPGAGGVLMVALAENARMPIDNPATHLELTMVHEAMILEYSGRHLAVIELAATLKLLLYVSRSSACSSLGLAAARHRCVGVMNRCRRLRANWPRPGRCSAF